MPLPRLGNEFYLNFRGVGHLPLRSYPSAKMEPGLEARFQMSFPHMVAAGLDTPVATSCVTAHLYGT